MKHKYIGVVLLVVGIALLVWGYSVYDAAGSQIVRAISGDTPIEAWAGLVGGGICVLLGILKLK